MDRFDVVVIGAGAAGLMAAIAAAEKGARVRLLDSRPKIGAKILVAGGGRCNVTNEYVDPTRFHTESDPAGQAGGSRSFVGRVLRAFSVEQTHYFFRRVGVELKLESTGKYFPVTDSSRTVLNALLNAVHKAGAELVTAQPVRDLAFDTVRNCWIVHTESEQIAATAVVLCTGGLALPKSGSDGSGYAFATRLGHTLIKTTPALTPLLLSQKNPKTRRYTDLSGLTLPVRLTLYNEETDQAKNSRALELASYEGSFLFTHTGFSGPVALNISRHVARERWQYPQAAVAMRLLPHIDEGEEGKFWQDFVRAGAKKTVANAVADLLPQRLAESVALQAGVVGQTLGRLDGEAQRRLRRALFNQPVPVSGVADYVKAEATAGGISLAEIEPATMMSKLARGLFLAGEICDVDGWLGGYNFQWAWSSGTVAGRGAARYAARVED